LLRCFGRLREKQIVWAACRHGRALRRNRDNSMAGVRLAAR
jgi:hypothetical protein